MPNAPAGKSEYLTRKQIVDSKVRAAGWRVAAFKPNRPLSAYDKCAIEEFQPKAGLRITLSALAVKSLASSRQRSSPRAPGSPDAG